MDASANVLPLDKQPKAVRWAMQIAEGVRKSSTIRVGPAQRAENIPNWLALGAPMNWWIVKNYGGKQSDWSGYPADVRPIVGDAEVWTYHTNGVTLQPGHESEIVPFHANGIIIEGCRLEGRMDSIEKRDGKILIIDYKTGASVSYLKMNYKKLDPDDPDTWRSSIGSLQLPCYVMIYAGRNNIDLRSINAAYLMLGSLF